MAFADEVGARERDRVRALIARSLAEFASERGGVPTGSALSSDAAPSRTLGRAGWRTDRVLVRRVAVQLRNAASAVRSAPPGAPLPWALIRDAWAAYRHGIDGFIADPRLELNDSAIGVRAPRLRARLWRAIAIYEAFADFRPHGWPVAGAAALLVLAADPRPFPLIADIQRLLHLARDMRALALHDDPDRLERARRRAERRAAGYPPRHRGQRDQLRFDFRIARPALEQDGWGMGGPHAHEQRRRALRDKLLRAGEHPGLSDAAWAFAEEQQQRQLAAIRAAEDRLRRAEQQLDAELRYLTWQQQEAERSTWIAQRGYDPDEPRAYLPDGMTDRALRYAHERDTGGFPLPDRWNTGP